MINLNSKKIKCKIKYKKTFENEILNKLSFHEKIKIFYVIILMIIQFDKDAMKI